MSAAPLAVSVPKSCPFCGMQAAVHTINWAPSYLKEQRLPDGTRFGVNCMSCGAQSRGVHGSATEIEAIDRWNKRTPFAADVPELSRLKADAKRWGAVRESGHIFCGEDGEVALTIVIADDSDSLLAATEQERSALRDGGLPDGDPDRATAVGYGIISLPARIDALVDAWVAA